MSYKSKQVLPGPDEVPKAVPVDEYLPLPTADQQCWSEQDPVGDMPAPPSQGHGNAVIGVSGAIAITLMILRFLAKRR